MIDILQKRVLCCCVSHISIGLLRMSIPILASERPSCKHQGAVHRFLIVFSCEKGFRMILSTNTAHPLQLLTVTFHVNGKEYMLELDSRVTLLDVLREHLAFTGSKKGCDHGQCGACTVLLNGRRINSCLALAVACQGAEIVTIEGLSEGEQLHPMQRAFIEHDAFQCGYCTPGQICSAVGMLREAKAGWPSVVSTDLTAQHVVLDEEEIRERMSGNLCRCAAYANIVPAIAEVSKLQQRTDEETR